MTPKPTAICLTTLVLAAIVATDDARAAEPACARLPMGGKVTVPTPQVTLETACDANCSGVPINIPIPSGAVWDFTDGSRNECAIKGGPANGKCKKWSICPPGTSKTNVNGTFRCIRPASTKQIECPLVRPSLMPFSIQSATNYANEFKRGYATANDRKIDGKAERKVAKPSASGCYEGGSDGMSEVILRGPNVGFAARAQLVGLPAVNVALSVPAPDDRRPEQCLLPNCVRALFTLPEAAPLGARKLEIALPTNRTAETTLEVVAGKPWAKGECKTGLGSAAVSRSGTSSAGGSQASYRTYTATMSCPGTDAGMNGQRAFTRSGARFTVNHPSGSVQATATAARIEECGWQDALKFKLQGPSGRDIVIDPSNWAPVSLTLANGDYVLEPPSEQNPNNEWPYGYMITIGFTQ